MQHFDAEPFMMVGQAPPYDRSANRTTVEGGACPTMDLQHQRRNPAREQQRDVVVDEGRDDRILDVVVLAVGVETHCRAEGGVGGG